MSIAERCSRWFPAVAVYDGNRLQLSDKVSVDHCTPTNVLAVVTDRGDQEFVVGLSTAKAAGPNEFSACCTCHEMRHRALCKHAWAVIAELDSRRMTTFSVPGNGQILVLREVLADDDLSTVEELKRQLGEGSTRTIDEDEFEPQFSAPSRNSAGAAAELPDWLRRAGPRVIKQTHSSKAKRPATAAWQRQLSELAKAAVRRHQTAQPVSYRPAVRLRQAVYLIDIEDSRVNSRLVIRFFQREQKLDGEFGRIKKLSVRPNELSNFADNEDRQLLEILLGNSAQQHENSSYYDSYEFRYGYSQAFNSMSDIAGDVPDRVAPIGRHGTAWLDRGSSFCGENPVVSWDDGPAWKFELAVSQDGPRKTWQIDGFLCRGEEQAPIDKPLLLLATGLVLFEDRLARLDAADYFDWIAALRQGEPIRAPVAQQERLLDELWKMPALPPVRLPEELRMQELHPAPVPRICFQSEATKAGLGAMLVAKVDFDYDGCRFATSDWHTAAVDRVAKKVIHRDLAREAELVSQLTRFGLQSTGTTTRPDRFGLLPKQFPKVAHKLMQSGWQVEAEGKLFRKAGNCQMSVTSNVDWFELDGKFDFDGVSATLPELLGALRRGEAYVTLGDGTQGMLPEDWLEKYGPLAEFAEADGDKLRFVPSQAMILDALLAAQPDAEVDQHFEEVRQKLRSFDGVQPSTAPPTFQGQLRDYQSAGLGWLHFLRDFRFGGCLADDMGLGKTVQVLALLELRRTRELTNGEPRRPSLAVVPRSLVYNWIDEARRFTPQLRVLDYTGTARSGELEKLDQYDLLVTTYGTLRRDIVKLQELPFDYAILDESQAIKNAAAQSSKACRLIQASNRLAMTGTPIENHLGELWALFEYLNPGMLGRSSTLKVLTSAASKDTNGDDGTRKLLANALRPFMLRRTKEQVLKELPEKTEQTLYCEMDTKQRKLYDELRDHYRAALSQRIETEGLQKSKIHVLEALLRLRQAACHPGLLDKSKLKFPSAKLESLLEQLDEVLAEGHKALVFSQFTSLLAIVKTEFDRRGITYEYLDGKTRNRKEKVERFQTDDKCPVFLISLKAGGQGLNLTAADYVFILDPWWNPAVEAQAVDRAHRIGQDRPVFAYRLIARDTVEEKILELQRDKRQLADAIVNADNSLLTSLTAADLQMLLS